MYYRLYPTKNNTLFHYRIPTASFSEDINCGANPIMELQDGRGESKLVFAFDLPDWLKTRLTDFSYTAKLQLWDAGTLFAPPANLKEVTLKSFEEDFTEGDGYSFLKPDNLVGVSNWLYRDATHLWSAVTFTDVTTYHLNTINEDLNFDITSSVEDFVTAVKNPRYLLQYTTSELGELVATKYLHSNHTKTIFKPYIEFFIADEINDKTFQCLGGVDNDVFLINQTGEDIVGTLTAKVTYDGIPEAATTVTAVRQGVYSVTLNPPVKSKQSYATLIWVIDNIDAKKQIITVNSPNQFEETTDYKNLFFYPTTPYTHNIVRQGDIIPFTVVSMIRGQGNVVTSTYEYKITTADGFEMIPWTSISVYREKMYFNVNTEFFFPEQQYEV